MLKHSSVVKPYLMEVTFFSIESYPFDVDKIKIWLLPFGHKMPKKIPTIVSGWIMKALMYS